MTAKDKATSLYNMFFQYTPPSEDTEDVDIEHEYTLACCMIAVEEIIQVGANTGYWELVKQEINNL